MKGFSQRARPPWWSCRKARRWGLAHESCWSTRRLAPTTCNATTDGGASYATGRAAAHDAKLSPTFVLSLPRHGTSPRRCCAYANAEASNDDPARAAATRSASGLARQRPKARRWCLLRYWACASAAPTAIVRSRHSTGGLARRRHPPRRWYCWRRWSGASAAPTTRAPSRSGGMCGLCLCLRCSASEASGTVNAT